MNKRYRPALLGVIATLLLLDGAVMCTSFSGQEPDATSDASASDASDAGEGNDAQSASDAVPIPDAARRGPPCIHVAGGGAGDFCIDATEITNAQYAEFVQSSERAVPPPRCTSSVVHAGTSGVGVGAVPVTFVGWCDAVAYCAWAGKHLCNTPSGKTLPQTLVGDPNTNAWRVACNTGAGGPGVDAGCNLASSAARPAIDGQCEIRDSGIYDLVANVWEWIDSCEDGGCTFMGGSWHSAAPGRCDLASGLVDFAFEANDVGFRCCGP